ncbi:MULTISPECIES: hypothetical protein [unclassified Ruminococcus]|uniref:hypothetical protein n=1 Tax=unclassified Ruminococcus TaxID=2608920 RepID=UPI00210B9F3D|nr:MULTISPECIES: hypothetical protein [unclassified Ruminococcus]MCQ4023028.1 hypothetical protein [Ruminococcus sp. zg-924]MCQ4115465.1 hypothetical protein [Ruminococcus sp. zg-921]
MAQGINDPMQRDAVRRMQEMHSRAAHSNGDSKPQNENSEQARDDKESQGNKATQSTVKQHSTAFPLSLQQLLADKDQSLVLIIILLLLGEHSDTSLVMALVYLIL